jgi:hypothetical protein
VPGRLLLGLIKGLILGGLVGYGAYAAGLGGGFNWLVYGVVGATVGLFVGRPFWSHLRDPRSTVVTSVIKAAFGFGVCVGIYAIVVRAWGGMDLTLAGETRNIYDWPPVFGAALGALWGAWVEADDAPPPAKASSEQGKARPQA